TGAPSVAPSRKRTAASTLPSPDQDSTASRPSGEAASATACSGAVKRTASNSSKRGGSKFSGLGRNTSGAYGPYGRGRSGSPCNRPSSPPLRSSAHTPPAGFAASRHG